MEQTAMPIETDGRKQNMNLMIDTTREHIGEQIQRELLSRGAARSGFERIDTTGIRISHCIGCNYCWLKTPGVCAIQDDYEPVLKKMSKADQVWLITDTHFGFVSHQTKNIVDRVMPIVTMYLKIQDGQMRHVMRYEHQPDIGIRDSPHTFLTGYTPPFPTEAAAHSPAGTPARTFGA